MLASGSVSSLLIDTSPCTFRMMTIEQFATLAGDAKSLYEVAGDESPTLIHEGETANGDAFYSLQVGAADLITVIYPQGIKQVELEVLELPA